MQVTLTIYAVGSVALSSIQSVADANFGNASTMQTFLQAATGSVYLVSGYDSAATVAEGGTSESDSSISDAERYGTLAGIVGGSLAGVALVSAIALVVAARAGSHINKTAPFNEPAEHLEKTDVEEVAAAQEQAHADCQPGGA